MLCKFLPDRFQWCKTTLGWSQRATWKKRDRTLLKSIAFHQNCKMISKKIITVLKRKKCLFLRKLTKMSNLIICSSGIPKAFICVFFLRLVAFLFVDWKKLSVSRSVLFTVFALEMRERKVYKMCLSFSIRSPF